MANNSPVKPTKLIEQMILDILAHEMGLAKDQDIWIFNQNKKIPNDDKLYVVVGFQDATGGIISVTNTVEPTDTGMKEIQKVIAREVIQVDIASASNEALARRWEIILALRSVFSQQQQEKYGIKIFRIPQSFVNTSSAEGGSQFNRFTALVVCHASHYKEKVLSSCEGDYYDDFDTRVDDEQSIGTDEGIIEFNIKGEVIT